MSTTREARNAFLADPCEISSELFDVFHGNDEVAIADIGACDGLSSIRYARLFPRARIYAFEAREDNYNEMVANFAEYGIADRSTAYCVALSNKAGFS
ncbi:unnamed protein product, partial [marine sediment metagenome]